MRRFLLKGDRKFGTFESPKDSILLVARWPHFEHFCFSFGACVEVKVVCSDAVEIVRPRDFIEDTIPAREVGKNSSAGCWKGEFMKLLLNCKLSPKIEDNLPLARFGLKLLSPLSVNVKALSLLAPHRLLGTDSGFIFKSLFSACAWWGV